MGLLIEAFENPGRLVTHRDTDRNPFSLALINLMFNTYQRFANSCLVPRTISHFA